ncbi:MAG: DNA-binding protein [Stackebrandtia sp.]
MKGIPRSGISHRSRVWTLERVAALGTTTDVETAGQILGIGRTLSYQLAKNDEFPVRVLRVGQMYKVPVPALLAALGTEPEESRTMKERA